MECLLVSWPGRPEGYTGTGCGTQEQQPRLHPCSHLVEREVQADLAQAPRQRLQLCCRGGCLLGLQYHRRRPQPRPVRLAGVLLCCCAAANDAAGASGPCRLCLQQPQAAQSLLQCLGQRHRSQFTLGGGGFDSSAAVSGCCGHLCCGWFSRQHRCCVRRHTAAGISWAVGSYEAVACGCHCRDRCRRQRRHRQHGYAAQHMLRSRHLGQRLLQHTGGAASQARLQAA